MKKLVKGEPGYINARKMRYLMWAVLEFAVVILLVILGYIQTGSRMNLLTVVAIVGCLPASKMLVEYITMAPYKSIAPEYYEEICKKAPLLVQAYDLVLTTPEKVMSVDVVVISDHVVCGYTSNQKTDVVTVANYIKEVLAAEHCEKITVKVFHDYHAFLARAEGMNNMASVSQEDHTRKELTMSQAILSISM